MNRKRPFKYDYGFMITTVILAAFFLVATSIMITNADPRLDGTQNDTVTFTVGELYDLLVLVVIIVNVWIIVSLVVDPVLDILHARKRREFPIDENDQL